MLNIKNKSHNHNLKKEDNKIEIDNQSFLIYSSFVYKDIQIYNLTNNNKNSNKKYCIYVWINLKNNKKYVGLTTKDVNERIRQHLNLTKHLNRKDIFHNALKKYPNLKNWNVFILKYCETLTELKKQEFYWINFFNTYVHRKYSWGYNASSGKEGSKGYHHSPEQRYNISAKSQKKIILKSTEDKLFFVNKVESYLKSGLGWENIINKDNYFQHIRAQKLKQRYHSVCKELNISIVKSKFEVRELGSDWEIYCKVSKLLRKNFNYIEIVKYYQWNITSTILSKRYHKILINHPKWKQIEYNPRANWDSGKIHSKLGITDKEKYDKIFPLANKDLDWRIIDLKLGIKGCNTILWKILEKHPTWKVPFRSRKHIKKNYYQ